MKRLLVTFAIGVAASIGGIAATAQTETAPDSPGKPPVAEPPAAKTPAALPASTEERIKRLEAIIQQQQGTISKQEQRLKELETRPAHAAPPRRAQRAPDAPQIPPIFLDSTRMLFQVMNEESLSGLRAGNIAPMVRVQLPDGSNVVIPAAAIGDLLAQATTPREPDFTTEPAPPATQPPAQPPRRPPPRAVQRAPQQPPAQPPAQPPPPATPPADDERAKGEKAQDQALLERGAILLRPGALQIEPGFEYSKFGGNQVTVSGFSIFDAIIIGTVRVDAQDRDVLNATAKIRYGILSRLQVDGTIPYVYRRDREILGIGTSSVSERITDSNGIGDMELGVSGQPLIGSGWIPNVLTRVSVRFPTGKSGFQIPTVRIGAGNDTRLEYPATGSGFWATTATVTAVWAIDPVVLFAGGGYTVNWSRTWGGFGRVNPGDSFEFFAGLNFALNERVSFNFTFINSRTASTLRDGQSIPNTSFTDARAVFGTSIGITKSVNVVMNAGIGLTTAAPNFTFYMSVPITFQIFD